MKKRPKVGIALGGGGLKSLSAVAVFDFLRKEEIPIDVIVGTSGGALVSAVCMVFPDHESILHIIKEASKKNFFEKPNYFSLMGLLGIPFFSLSEKKGIIDGQPYQDFLKKLFQNIYLEDINPKLIFKTTDIYTGESVNLEKGLLWKAVYASSSIYPFLPPIEIENRYFADGAFSSPLGVSSLIEENIDFLIVVSFHFVPNKDPKNFLHYFNNLLCTSIDRKGHQALATPLSFFEGSIVHINIKMDTEVYLNETEKLFEVVQVGQEIMKAKGIEILKNYRELTTVREESHD